METNNNRNYGQEDRNPQEEIRHTDSANENKQDAVPSEKGGSHGQGAVDSGTNPDRYEMGGNPDTHGIGGTNGDGGNQQTVSRSAGTDDEYNSGAVNDSDFEDENVGFEQDTDFEKDTEGGDINRSNP